MRRLEPFVEDPASMQLMGALVDATDWPQGAELNDLFDVEEWGELTPLADVHLRQVTAADAVPAIVEVLTVGQAYGGRLEESRVADAESLARDLVDYLGPEATWLMSWEDHLAANGTRSVRSYSSMNDATFAAGVIGRGPVNVLILVAFDED